MLCWSHLRAVSLLSPLFLYLFVLSVPSTWIWDDSQDLLGELLCRIGGMGIPLSAAGLGRIGMYVGRLYPSRSDSSRGLDPVVCQTLVGLQAFGDVTCLMRECVRPERTLVISENGEYTNVASTARLE